MGVKEWIEVNAQAYETHISLTPWSFNFLQTLWYLGKQRCSVVFEMHQPNNACLAQSVLEQVQEEITK